MIFKIVAIAVLALFYGIYFTKMFLQKRQGIQTRQLRKRKERGIYLVETVMSVATLSVVPVQIVSVILDWSWLPSSARFTGFLLGMFGDLIFLISIIAMKNSWRAGIPEDAKTELVTDGIYCFSRNPAFVGFDFMYIGVCLLFCNPFTLFFSVFSMVMLHLQILQEEKYLEQTFGDSYVQYKRTVFRYLGRHR